MKEIKKENGVVTKLDNIEVVELFTNEFGEKTRVGAHIRQNRTTTYPAQRLDTGFGAGMFDNPEGQSFEQIRNTIVPVPEGLEKEDVQNRVDEFVDACIYRILSNNLDDVVSNKEKQAVESGLIEKESLTTKHLVRDKEGNVYANLTTDGEVLKEDDRKVGKIVETPEGDILEVFNPNALWEYKRDIFSREYREDIDMREKANVEAKVLAEADELAV